MYFAWPGLSTVSSRTLFETESSNAITVTSATLTVCSGNARSSARPEGGDHLQGRAPLPGCRRLSWPAAAHPAAPNQRSQAAAGGLSWQAAMPAGAQCRCCHRPS
ncbi:hypothetical protein ABPG75_011016 [Micractinium tetrahymenae]